MTQINRNQLKQSNLTGASLHDDIGIYSEIVNYNANDIVIWQAAHYKCVNAVTATIEGDLSNAPDVSTDWVLSESAIYSCYPSSSQSFTSSLITVNFNTERHSNSEFSLSSGEITFNRDGTFIVCVTMSIDNTQNKESGANSFIEMDTGSGYSTVSDFKISTFHIDQNKGQDTGCIEIPITVSTNDKLRVRTQRYYGNGTLETIPEGCNVTIFTTKGMKGPQGDQGIQGVAGAPGDIDWKGAWVAGTYNENDAVEYNGSSFVCIANGTTLNPGTPSSPNTGWDLLAKKGLDGSGTTVNISDSGTSLPNTPHSRLNFTGDLTATDSGGGTAEINYVRPKNRYMTPLWAEENANIGAGNYEWAFGNGANTPNDGGVTIFVPSGYSCQVIGMSLRIGSGTATVELVKNGTLQGSNCDVTVSTGQGATNTISPPISVSDGDYLNFRTTNAANGSAPNVVTAWLEYVEN